MTFAIPPERLRKIEIRSPRPVGSASSFLARMFDRSPCESCIRKCCNEHVVEIRTDDPNADRLKSLFGRRLDLFPDRAILRLGEEECPFLARGMCRVRDVRAEICRVYPLTIYEQYFNDGKDVVLLNAERCWATSATFDKGFGYLYVDELIDRTGSAPRPTVPMLGNAIISLLQARSSIYQNWQIIESQNGPLLPIFGAYVR